MLCCILLVLCWLLPVQGHAADKALLLDIQGAIGPAVAEDVERALDKAESDHAKLVILRMDTPGGLDKTMRSIIKNILASPIPVATFVAPKGARAASAGTYILYASHIAAMAPATNLGAATPVQIGGMPSRPDPIRKLPAEGEKSPQITSPAGGVMQHKIVNDAAAYIRSLAELRGRNADWAEKAVREAVSLSSEQALQQQVIDVVAADVDQLLLAIDGRKLSTSRGEVVLHSKDMSVETVQRSWRSKLLAVITDPNVAYILMLLGIYGLFFELANPGFVLPGVIGGISLLLALFAFQVLPVNYAGLALMALGIAFMIGEVFAPSFGALGLGGVIAFVAGSIMLMDASVPGFALSLALIIGVALTSAAFFILIVGMALKARRRPVVSGSEEMTGAFGEAVEDFDTQGKVHIHGEIWQATAISPISKGQTVRITGMQGLILSVEAKEDTS
ncbi:MAG: nodulation protein NfeD [Mariprofundaceae bacterium]|nr:nodulation protein NfeD [Mariprofundaceae bacterium]